MKPFNGGQPVILKNWTGGVNQNVADSLVPQNTVKMALNMYSDQEDNFGSLRSRMGKRAIIDLDTASSAFSFPIPKTSGIHGLFSCGTISPSNNGGMIIAARGYTYFLNSSDTLQNIGTTPFHWGTSLIKLRFTKYLNYIYACNGTYIKSWDGVVANDWGATNLTSAPTGNLITEYKGKLYVSANSTYKSRVYFSKLPNSSGGLDAWDTTNDYFDVAPEDGDRIISIKKMNNILLIFKYYSLYIWDGTSLTRIDNYGTVSHETVTVIENNVYFLSIKETSLSICVFDGQKVNVISAPVNQWLKNVHVEYSMQYAHTTGVESCSFDKNQNYYLYLGDWATRRDAVGLENSQNTGLPGIYEGGFYANVLLKFNTKENSWNEMFIPAPSSVSSGYKNGIFFAVKRHIETVGNGSEPIVILGRTSQKTDSTTALSISAFYWEEYVGNTFTGILSNTVDFLMAEDSSQYNTIPYTIQTNKIDFGQRGAIKQLNKFHVFVDGDYSNATFHVRIDGGKWVSKGNLSNKMNTFEVGDEGYYFEFKITGFTSNNSTQSAALARRAEPFIFEGFEFGNIKIEGYEE